MSRQFACLLAVVALLVTVSVPALAEPSDENPATRVKSTYLSLPLNFEPNVGQAPADTRFLARGAGYAIYLSETGASILLAPASEMEPPSLLTMTFAGAQRPQAVNGVERMAGVVNYMVGARRNWRTGVPTFARVQFAEVYPGIDAVFYGNQRNVEYDFVVTPGADPSHIELAFQGARSVRIDKNGDLLIAMQDGEVRQHRPIVYQEIDGQRRHVRGEYVLLAKQRVGFELGDYDRSKPLLIDPVLSYATYLGGNHLDNAESVAVDGSNRAYVTGTTYWGFPTKTPFQGNQAGRDAFVTKFWATGGGLIYSTYLGGSSDVDMGVGIAVDRFGAAYVAGITESPDFPVTSGAFQTVHKGGREIFVTKLNPSGTSLAYSTFLGGNGDDLVNGMAIDSNHRVYVAGSSCAADYPTQNAYQSSLNTAGCGRPSFHAGILTRLNPSGTDLDYSTYFPSLAFAVAVDSTFHAYIAGAAGTGHPTTSGAFQASPRGSVDNYVTKFSADGSTLVYSTFVGGTGTDRAHAIAVDPSDRAYITGMTDSADYPTTSGAFRRISSGGFSDAFVTKLWATGGGLIYSTYLGGSGDDVGNSIAVDSNGQAHVTGFTSSPNFPLQSAIQGTKGGTFDAFVAKLTSGGGGLMYSTYWGGSSDDFGRGVRLDGSGNAYVVGETESTDMRTTSGAFDRSRTGASDGFLIKITK